MGMTGMEKVIKGFEHCKAMYGCYNCQSIDREDCPYVDEPDCRFSIMQDAIALLKEQEAVKIEVKKINSSGRCGRCPNCLIELNEMDYPNYCGYCGQKVKWE